MEKGKKTAAKKTAGKACGVKKAPAKSGAKSPAAAVDSGFKKRYSKTKPVCKVTFVLPVLAAPSAEIVCLVGEFNNWSITQHPMKRLKNGDFSISIDLETGREYQFRYLIDDCRWENDWNADKYVATMYGDSENSVVIV
jgi:1,4-alpha-glucan branching enzyme